MGTIRETRYIPARESKDHIAVPYTVYTPTHLASDKTFDNWFASQLREFLYRRGIRVDHIPDDTLLTQTRNTFQTVTLRDGVTVAKPVD